MLTSQVTETAQNTQHRSQTISGTQRLLLAHTRIRVDNKTLLVQLLNNKLSQLSQNLLNWDTF